MKRRILAIDPGPIDSAMLFWDGQKISSPRIMENIHVRTAIKNYSSCDLLAVEMIASYGMPVGKEVFETCVEIGRFVQCWQGLAAPILVYRKDVKMHLCASSRAKDSNIRQALLDRFGVPGTKNKPGLTYGLRGDLWQAFALAVYVSDRSK